ncbi:MAG TPA: TadE/TadG family type IV pilus assembly protein [Aliidongia sp.]|uniref:TadE/TadG family type IV pilus assembly protein n=1 Tax=Aliidongia sp. TaxID=1914230 RepID=UPI002DDCF90A|nr:TadE/TadG family type IV pilus assembly protein [Aliidongia sp.]HEV2676360.1 TadE/TadG family type IV pilus assembly protein [Aliidongia sp.]
MSVTNLLRKLCRDRSGVAAVEFALVVPVLLVMWLGMEQFSELTTADSKTLMAAQSVSDMVAQVGAWQNGQFNDIVNAATQIMAPLPTSGALTVDVVGVAYDSSNQPTMTGGWRCTSSGGPAADTTIPLSTAYGLGVSGQTIIMVNVKYAFQPAVSFQILTPAVLAALGAKTLSERSFNRPRLGLQVAKPC